MRKTAILFFLLSAVNVAIFYLMNSTSTVANFAFEYGNIAAAVIEGRGFSDPFGNNSGPTAWMPPLYVWILAGIFKIAGLKSIASMYLHYLLQSLAYAGIAVMMLAILRRHLSRSFSLLIIPIFYLLMLLNRQVFFIELHDIWLLMFLSCLLIYTFTKLFYRDAGNPMPLLILLSIALPLSSPGLSLAFLLLAFFFAFLHPRLSNLFRSDSYLQKATSSYHQKIVLASVVLFFITLGSWTYRNYEVFGEMIPLKSNLWYDFYQANELDRDGVVSDQTFMQHHPVQNIKVREEYSRKGEIGFVKDYEHFAQLGLKQDPMKFFRKVLNRFSNAFLYTQNSNDLRPFAEENLDPTTVSYMEEQQLVLGSYWICLDMEEVEFILRISALSSEQIELLLSQWKDARNDLKIHNRKLLTHFRSLSLSLIPFLGLFLLLLSKKLRNAPLIYVMATVYFIHLGPYVLISHYMRYQFPMIALQSLIFVLVLGFIFKKIQDYSAAK